MDETDDTISIPQQEATTDSKDESYMDKYRPFDKLPKSEKLQRAKRDYSRAVIADIKFQKASKQAFMFYAGDQYTREEEEILRKTGRPDLKCNLVKPAIELIKGVNEQNKIEIKAQATETNDGFLSDILNDCYEKVYEIEDVGMQVDDSLENYAISGRGFLAVDIEPDPKRPGEIKIPVTSVLPGEIRIDPASRKEDLSDARHIFWHKWIALEDFAMRYPDAMEDIDTILEGDGLGDLFSIDPDSIDDFDSLPTDTPEGEEYSTVMDTGGYYDKSNGHIRIVHEEYWCNYDRYYGVNPSTGQLEEFDAANLEVLLAAVPGFQYEAIKDKKVKWFQFTGHKVLYDGDSPIPFDGFSIVSEFLYKDKSTGAVTHFGVVKDMIDPQREANKRWSQTLNLFLGQHQGCSFVEEGAILDEKHWEDTVRQPGADTVVANGAIAGNKIMPKPIPQLPTGSLQMHELAKDLMKKVTGIDNDLLGVGQNSGEPGVVIRLRQQQGLTMLAKLYKNHNRMQEQLAKRIYAIIMKYMPDTQIQRILGSSERYKFEHDAYYGDVVVDLKNNISAPIRNLRDLKYNIDVEENPANMTKTMAQLAIFMDMMSKGFTVDPKVVINRLDLPESDKSEWIKYVEQTQEAQSQQAQAQQQQAQAVLQLQQQQTQTMAQREQIKSQNEQAKIQMDAAKIAGDHELKRMELAQEELDDRYDFTADMARLGVQERQIILDLIQRLAGYPMTLPQGQQAANQPVPMRYMGAR